MTRRFERPDRRGVSLVLVALFLVALMGIAALAVDLGMLQKARAEAQRAADAAALAGASALLLDDTRVAESTLAVHRARVLADSNSMMGTKIDSTSEVTVWVIYDSIKVRVKVRRASVPTWFARVFGLNAFPVGAVAAAKADYATGAKCVKPIALPDLWQDAGDLVANGGNGNNRFDLGETWIWNVAPTPDVYNRANHAGEGSGTGLGSDLRNTYPYERDWGLQIVLRPTVTSDSTAQPCPGTLQGNKCYSPGFWGLWGSNQTKELGEWIVGCNLATRFVDSTYGITSGWRAALQKDVETVYGDKKLGDADAHWDTTAIDSSTGRVGSVVGSRYGHQWRQSPRVWIMSLMAPADVPITPSDNDTRFNNFMLFFFEGCMNKQGTGNLSGSCTNQDVLVGRFIGLAKGTATGPSPGTMTRILRLVE